MICINNCYNAINSTLFKSRVVKCGHYTNDVFCNSCQFYNSMPESSFIAPSYREPADDRFRFSLTVFNIELLNWFDRLLFRTELVNQLISCLITHAYWRMGKCKLLIHERSCSWTFNWTCCKIDSPVCQYARTVGYFGSWLGRSFSMGN